MSLMERIQTDLKNAMKSQDKETVSVLRMVISDLKYAKAAVSMSHELADEATLKVVQAYHKKLEKSLGDYPEGEAREKLQAEMRVVETYLPKKASAEAVAAAVQAVLGETSERHFGSLMKAVTAKLGAGADGKVISEVLKKALG